MGLSCKYAKSFLIDWNYLQKRTFIAKSYGGAYPLLRANT
jgi:hypothetical protein